jgi:ketosteroid isomerase-like protein
VEAVRAGFDAFNAGDDDAWVALWHEDAELHELAEVPDADVYRGHDGIRAWVANVRSSLGDFRFEPRRLAERGETVVVDVAASGTGAGSGVPVEWTTYIVLELRDGKVARGHGFLNREDALEAAGLRE